MKVVVKKEMPFAKVGEVFKINNVKDSIRLDSLGCYAEWRWSLEDMIRDGWLEEVKEERLEDKLESNATYNAELIDSYDNHINNCVGNWKELAQIAKDHYLEVFDNFVKDIIDYAKSETKWGYHDIENIRKALEQA